MTILDYHQKVLCPNVWDSTEQTLTPRASVQIDEQVGDRFPDAVALYIVGDMTGHYWTDSSDLDLLIKVPKDKLAEYRDEARSASGYFLANTKHKVNFFLVPEDLPAEDISRNFGLLYDLSLGTWFGTKNWSTNELTRPSAFIAHINWKLFKVKRSLNPTPYDWKMLIAAFRDMGAQDRQSVLKALRGRVVRLDASIEEHLKGEPKEHWKQVEELEQELEEGTPDIDTSYIHLPQTLLYAVLHTFRYEDLLETLEQVDESMSRQERTASADEPVVARRVTEEEPIPEEQANYWKRIDLLATRICQARGGFSHATETFVELFSYLLDGNRFIRTKLRQREIALAIYNKYYRGNA